MENNQNPALDQTYCDLKKAQFYKIDPIRVYNAETGVYEKVEASFIYNDEPTTPLFALELMIQDKTSIRDVVRMNLDPDIFHQMIYNYVYEYKDHSNLINYPVFRKKHDELLRMLIGENFILPKSVEKIEGFGVIYSEKQHKILSFISELEFNLPSGFEETGYIFKLKEDEIDPESYFIFYTPEYQGKFITSRTNPLGMQLKEEVFEKLPDELQSILKILPNTTYLEKAKDLKSNKSYLFDEIIKPMKEDNRKKTIISQFADIDLDF